MLLPPATPPTKPASSTPFLLPSPVEEPVPPPKKLNKHAKKRAKEERERAIHAAELRRLQGDAAPASEQEFEQLLLASPNSSYVWIKYMAFLIRHAAARGCRAAAAAPTSAARLLALP